jgi:hypothetical protein
MICLCMQDELAMDQLLTKDGVGYVKRTAFG